MICNYADQLSRRVTLDQLGLLRAEWEGLVPEEGEMLRATEIVTASHRAPLLELPFEALRSKSLDAVPLDEPPFDGERVKAVIRPLLKRQITLPPLFSPPAGSTQWGTRVTRLGRRVVTSEPLHVVEVDAEGRSVSNTPSLYLHLNYLKNGGNVSQSPDRLMRSTSDSPLQGSPAVYTTCGVSPQESYRRPIDLTYPPTPSAYLRAVATYGSGVRRGGRKHSLPVPVPSTALPQLGTPSSGGRIGL